MAITGEGIRALDPFGFFIGHASCIRPLGGAKRGPDPTYAFHTAYMEYRPGPVVLTLRFTGLAASFGELVIHVNSFVPGSGAHALLVTMSRLSVVELAENGTDIVLRFSALPDVGYAVFGYFPEGTDATATSLTIEAEEQGTAEDARPAGEAREPTAYGEKALGRPDRLVTAEPLTFRSPVSQIMTSAQCEEESYQACVRDLALEASPKDTGWKQAFVRQTLDRYGFLASGARGLSLDDADSPLAAALVARGCAITIARHVDAGSEASLTPGRFPALCPDALFDTHCHMRGFDPKSFDPELCGHDFLWSIDLASRDDIIETPQKFITLSLGYLRPRGLAIHLFDVGLDGDERAGGALSRIRLEALALTLISRGNDVAQLNFDDGRSGHRADALHAGRVAPFGLIIRRGMT